MATRFTVLQLDKLQPREQRYDIFDSETRGLGLRVFTTGKKSFFLSYRRKQITGGKLRRVTIGHYARKPERKGEASLAAARAEVERLRKQIDAGDDIAGTQRAQRTAILEAPTVAQLADEFIERYAKREKKSWKYDERILSVEVLPALGQLKAQNVTRANVVRLLEAIADRGSPVMANRVLACVRRMFRWAIQTKRLGSNPNDPTSLIAQPGGAEQPRRRELTPEEIRVFWFGLDRAACTPAVRAALRLALLTGTRSGEVTSMDWSEVDLTERWWTIPGSRRKGSRKNPAEDLRVPLSGMAVEILEALHPRDTGPVYPSPRGDQPIQQRTVGRALDRAQEGDEPAIKDGEHFSPHDLRRTCATRLGEMQVPPHVIGAILGHKKTDVAGRHYNRYAYGDEKRQALEAWTAKLEEYLSGGTVVALRR